MDDVTFSHNGAHRAYRSLLGSTFISTSDCLAQTTLCWIKFARGWQPVGGCTKGEVCYPRLLLKYNLQQTRCVSVPERLWWWPRVDCRNSCDHTTSFRLAPAHKTCIRTDAFREYYTRQRVFKVRINTKPWRTRQNIVLSTVCITAWSQELAGTRVKSRCG